MRQTLGKEHRKEYREQPYICGVVRKNYPGALRATHVFKVQDRGKLIAALVKLQYARDIWGSRLFLMVTRERDLPRIQRPVAPLLADTFRRIARNLVVLSADRAEELCDSLTVTRD
ncbi:MAG: hypothetical protein AB1609_13285 [Bacillota bacterium]